MNVFVTFCSISIRKESADVHRDADRSCILLFYYVRNYYFISCNFHNNKKIYLTKSERSEP